MPKLPLSLLLLVATLAAGCAPDAPMGPSTDTRSPEGPLLSSMDDSEHRSADVNKFLAAIRRATAKFHDSGVAEAAGYHNEGVCITAAMVEAPAELGAMGVHFVNEHLIDGTFDPREPEVLVYEPRGDGSLHLVGVEYLFVGDDPPHVVGDAHFHPFPLPFADFALHAWVWKPNPSGMFADFNPNVTCPTE